MIGRIVLPKTTTMSLNDRFSHMRQLREQKQQQQQQLVVPGAVVWPQQPAGGAASSAENRRLVAQMESRPAVLAALRGQATPRLSPVAAAAAVPRARQSVQQRLSVKARLGVVRSPAARGATGAGRSILARLGRVRPVAKRLQPARVGARLQTALPWGRGAARGRGRGRPVARAVTGAGGRIGWRGRGRGRARGRGRGRGGGAGSAPPRLSREELDRQLDNYMASTKGQLDAELDAYMKESVI